VLLVGHLHVQQEKSGGGDHRADGAVWEASESADTRCWRLLPDRIQVLRLELPASEHTVGLRADAGFGPPGENQRSVRIADGRNTYLLATLVDGRLIGKILASAD
jgi:hypothetical protein